MRINGAELRCRVVGEGGNLGLSQRGRIEYAEAGGRINTDFIDNSAGVNTSDLEVNLKILFNPLMASGRLPRPERNALLASMTDEVSRLVLRNNYLQSLAIATLQARAPERVAEFGHVIHALERAGTLDRAMEALPTGDEIAERRRKGLGLTRPELAMLLSYSKIWLSDRLGATDIADDPFLGGELTRYFPEPVQRRFPRDIQKHQLRREIIVTAITNSLVNRMGPVFAIRMQEDTAADVGSIARAYSVAREITGMRELWADIEALDDQAPTALQYDMLVETTRLLRHLSYWVLRTQGRDLDIERAVSRLQPGIRELMRDLPELIEGTEVERYERALARYSKDDVPPKVARRVASLGAIHAGVDIVEVALARRARIGHAARVYFGLGAALGLDWLRDQIEHLVVEGHWQAVARGTLREDLYLLQRQPLRARARQPRPRRRARVRGGLAQVRRRDGREPRPHRARDACDRQRGFPDAYRRAAVRAAPRRALRRPMPASRLVLVRHGQSAWNLENLFTGWTDVDLTAQGREEARAAGQLLREQGFEFGQAHTSVLKRAIRTLWIIQDEMDRMWIPVERDWRLNERHYGALQGLDKAETTAKYGAEQVKVWRRSYDIPPPPLAADDPRHPRFDVRYRGHRSRAAAGHRIAQGHARPRRALVARMPRARTRRGPRRARRRAWQQPARARQDAGRHERRRDRRVQHPDRRADPLRTGREAAAGLAASFPGRRRRDRSGRPRRRRASRTALGRRTHSSGAISTSRPASDGSNGTWQDRRDPRGRKLSSSWRISFSSPCIGGSWSSQGSAT